MSEPKKGGLFINKKSTGSTATPPLAGLQKPKDVKKRWMFVGIAAVGVVMAGSVLLGDGSSSKPRVKKDADGGAMVSVNPPNADKQAFESSFRKDLERIKIEQEKLKMEMQAKDRELEKLRDAQKSGGNNMLPAGITPPPLNPNNGLNNGNGLPSLTTPPPPPPPPLTTTPPVSSQAPNIPVLTPPSGSSYGGSDPMVFEAPSSSSSASKTNTAANGTGVEARTRYARNPSAGLLPAGSFAPIALLNGLDAGTSTATQSNPMPVLMQVTDKATLPGVAKYQLKNCFLLGNGYGDLSAERVYVRFGRLSCVDRKDRLVLSQDVQGYLVDSDGKLGLRGVITDRQGAKVGKALLAGFAQGMAGALGSAQGTVTSNSATGNVTNSLTGSAALRASGLTGAQTAVSQLAEFYLKEAQAIFPVITIDAGRTGTVVFSASAALTFNDAENKFTQQVTPTNSN